MLEDNEYFIDVRNSFRKNLYLHCSGIESKSSRAFSSLVVGGGGGTHIKVTGLLS